MTDPKVESQYISADIGDYPVDADQKYLCVSIGEPYEGWRYKLAAGIIII